VDSVLLRLDIFPDILRKHTKIINYPSQYTCRNSNRAPTKTFRDFKRGPTEVMRAVKYAEDLVILTKEETVLQA